MNSMKHTARRTLLLLALVLNLHGALDSQAKNRKIQNRHNGAAQSSQENPAQGKGSDTELAQQKEDGDQDPIADEDAQGNAGNFFTGCGL